MDYDFRWTGRLTEDMQNSFNENGFFVARDFMDAGEVEQILKVLEEPDGILKHAYMTYEENGKRICRTLCKHPGNDVTGVVARSEKMVETVDKLLGTEVYHWCSMFVIKDARVGGEHVWHQDYGYWYTDGCIYPDMITAWIALDKCTRDSSCKQVLSGSHKIGRVNHGRVASGQAAADTSRVEKIAKHCKHVYLEMEPGDLFVHHGNLLHRSGANTSDRDRRAFMSCYNAAHNSPVDDTHYPSYVKINKVKNSAIKECCNYTDFSGKDFIHRAVNNMKRKKHNQDKPDD